MPSISNLMLAALPKSVYQHILPGLKPIELVLGDVLYEPGEPMRHVYFPDGCVVSLIVVMEKKMALEVALVGRDGMVGVPLALGAKLSPLRALVQGSGAALRMGRAAFGLALRRHEPLQRALDGYANTLTAQIARTAACNRYHLLEARLARWLLMTRDRVEASEFEITQEFMSAMLGVRRVGVSDAASSFQRRNLIEYRRGHMTILNHAGLEAASCSCYAHDDANPGALPPWRPRRARAAGPAARR
ncbi:MAG: Crp/Fnr family transcriptional regulator [Ramlibacter sp.]|nr:Crp/Fnr family transcriptional regulator [Ramlibacter sp.]